MAKKGRPILFDRKEVLEKALRLFWMHGYEMVSTDQICIECGITKPSLYNSFGTKEDFFIECLKEYNANYVSKLLAVMKSYADPIEGVNKMLSTAAKQFQSPKFPTGCLAITGLIEIIGKSKKIDKNLKIIQASFLKEFENYFYTRATEKNIIQSQEWAQFVVGQLYAIAVFSRSNKELFNFESFVKMSSKSFESIVRQ